MTQAAPMPKLCTVKNFLKVSTRAEVVEEGAKVSQNYHVVIVLM